MEIEKLKKLKYLFSLNENDMRPIFFLIILTNLSDYTNNNHKDGGFMNLYKLPYMSLIKSNDAYNEWCVYCMDLLTASNISIKQFLAMNQDASLFDEKIIKAFFKLEYGNEDITHNAERWKQATKITRLNDKIEKLTGISLKPDYKKSSDTQFKFNETILKEILKSTIDMIPKMKCLQTINLIDKCMIDTNQKQCLDYLEQCFKGRDIASCKKFMNQDNYLSNITNEVKSMDICVAAETLVKLGFKSNKTLAICFESYDLWEERMLQLLQIKTINPKLIVYIRLLLERVNPIMLLKKELELKGGGYSIANVLKEYSSKNNKLILPIHKHNNMENKYHTAKHIVSLYSLLMKVFNNNKVFNYDNRKMYIEYYDKIHYKYLSNQKQLLDIIQNS